MSAQTGRRLPRGLFSIAFAGVAFLSVSCGSSGQTADADATTNTPETLQSSEAPTVPDGAGVVLVDLDDAGEVATWTTVNDPVMGGKSASTITFGDGALVFSGTISLDNNGGFASARSPQDPDMGRKAAAATSLRVHARGDGKTYLLKVGTEGQPWSYVQRFPTEAGVQRIYDLPVGGFEPVGMRLDPAPDAPQKLDPSTIDEVAVYILDKQQGPFEISVSTIDATS